MMRDIVRDSMSLERVGSFMMLFFALAALLMASLGIYGVVSYSVRQATVEIGTRMALGAVGRDLLRMVVGGGLKMAAYGAAIGGVAVVAAAWLLVRVFEIRDLGALPFVASTAVVGRSLRRSRHSFRRGGPRGCRRWWRSGTSRDRCGSRRGRQSGRRSRAVRGGFARRRERRVLGRRPADGVRRGRARLRRLLPRRSSERSRRCGERLGAQSVVLLEQASGRISAARRDCRRMQSPRRSLPARGLSRESAQVLQLPAAVHDRRPRQLAAVGDETTQPEHVSRDSDIARRRRADGRAAAGQGRHPRHAAAWPTASGAAVQRRPRSISCANARSS